jgi:hypothetical protein
MENNNLFECKIKIQNLLDLELEGSFLFPAVILGLGILKYQDQVQEFSGQVTQPIKDALELLGPYLGEAKDKILVSLANIKEKVTRTIKDALELLGPYLGEAKDKILVSLAEGEPEPGYQRCYLS